MEQQLVEAFAHTLSPDLTTIRAAEDVLHRLQIEDSFPSAVFQVLSKGQPQVAVAASIFLKNFIRKHWSKDDDDQDQRWIIPDGHKATFRSGLVAVGIGMTEMSLRSQLAEAVGFAAEKDFPLIPKDILEVICAKLREPAKDVPGIEAALHFSETVFKRYVDRPATDSIISEIHYVLSVFAEPFIELTKWIDHTLASGMAVGEHRDIIYELIRRLVRNLFCLVWQDIPEVIEDNLGVFLPLLHRVLSIAAGGVDRESVPPVLLTAVAECVVILASKYEEEVGASNLDMYLQDMWSTVSNGATAEGRSKNSAALLPYLLQYVRVLLHGPRRQLFEDVGHMTSILEAAILPAAARSEETLEEINDNPISFFLHEHVYEESSERRSVSGVMKAFALHFPTTFIPLVMEKGVQHLLMRNDGHMFDIAVFLWESVAGQTETKRDGVTNLNQGIDFHSFFNSVILNCLRKKEGELVPIMWMSIFRFLGRFRMFISPQEFVSDILPAVLEIIQNGTILMRLCAADFLHKYVTSTEKLQKRVGFAELSPSLESLLREAVGSIMQMDGCDVLDNEEKETGQVVLLQWLFTLLETASSSPQDMSGYVAHIIQLLTSILAVQVEKKQPFGTPFLAHLIFEVFALLIRCFPSEFSAFESTFFPIFSAVLHYEIEEWMPYVFQLLALLVNVRDVPLPEQYLSLIPSVLHPHMYSNPGAVSGVVSFLVAVLGKDMSSVISSGVPLESILGVCQKLLAGMQTDHYGYEVLLRMMCNDPSDGMKKFGRTLWHVLSVRLQREQHRTGKYVRETAAFVCAVLLVKGVDWVMSDVDESLLNLWWDVMLIDGAGAQTDIRKARWVVSCLRLFLENVALSNGNMERVWKLVSVVAGMVARLESSGKGGGLDVGDVDEEHLRQAIRMRRSVMLKSARLRDFDLGMEMEKKSLPDIFCSALIPNKDILRSVSFGEEEMSAIYSVCYRGGVDAPSVFGMK